MTIEETEPHPDGTVTVLATLEGAPFGTPVEAELHSPLLEGPATGVRIDALTVDASGAACVQLGPGSAEFLPGSARCPAECGRREH
ncbi:hypothetical protein [Streptomyces sp. F-1]|uniref:hypothetical protein n=1 Tax=Streptomyces sp. F-1 TaxID=463642 RepID=UPI0008697878|nr:hypothetical protein [Streptomyces sp. F-1]SFY46915.1 hypothetical protein STEPF1_00119 [Streptomyces sp. F-1]